MQFRVISRLLFLVLLAFLPGLAAAQLILKVTAIPAGTPASASLYLAGTLNNWQAAAEDYRLERDADGNYFIQLFPPAGVIEYKITRGGWDKPEGNEQGNYRPNRQVDYRGGRQVEQIAVLSWEDLDGKLDPASTSAPNVSLLSPDFSIPQLGRSRRIWIYLPPGYQQSDRRYPVLYMHDGQNLFDAATSFSGEWKVDETLNRLFEKGDSGVIVIGIDNGGAERLNEYSPWVNTKYGGGQGAAYIRFITETLKPYIDRNYRTLPGRDHTGIMGSSMGGLISLYAGIEYQQVFGKVGILSPALWFSEEAFTHLLQKGKKQPVKFYLMIGQEEGPGVVNDLYALENTLRLTGFDSQRIFLVTHPDGEHSEWYWAREFGDVYRWLFTNWPESEQPDAVTTPVIEWSGSGSRRRLLVQAVNDTRQLNARITRPSGEEVLRLDRLSNGRNRLPALSPDTYFVYLYQGDQLLAAKALRW